MLTPAAAPGRRPQALVMARVAVCLTFFSNGVGFSNLVPRYPEIVDRLGLSKAQFGQALMFSSVGALVAGLAASWFITRFTSARVASTGMVVAGLGLVAAGVAPSWIVLALSLAWLGGMDAVVDVAQNAHGLRVERRWGSSIITSFHAAWSLGAASGAAMGQALAGAGFPLVWHMVGVVALLCVISVISSRWMIPGPDADDRSSSIQATADRSGGSQGDGYDERGTPLASGPVDGPVTLSHEVEAVSPPSWIPPSLLVAVLGVMCAAAMVPEDVAGNWSSLLLTEQGAGTRWAGMGLVALQSVMIVGRLLGDHIIDRLGPRRVVAGGGLLVMAGMALALVLGTVGGTIMGMVVCGAGCAVAVPVAYAAADDVPGLRPGLGLTVVSWLARVIMLLALPVVGWFADPYGTWVALVYGLSGGLVLVLSWPVLRKGSSSTAASW